MSWRIEVAHEQAGSIAGMLRKKGFEGAADLVEARRDALHDALAMLAQDTIDAEAAEAEAAEAEDEETEEDQPAPPAEPKAEAPPPAPREPRKLDLSPEERARRGEQLRALNEARRKPADQARPTEPTARPAIGGQNSSLTEKRAAILRKEWGNLSITLQALLDLYNAEDGPTLRHVTGLYGVVRTLGLATRRTDQAVAEGRAPGQQQAAAQPAEISAEELAEARAMLRTGSAGAKALHEYFGWPLDQAQEIAAKLRAEIEAEAKAA